MAHDWNNLLLVLSMETDRLRELVDTDSRLRSSVEVFDQIIVDGRKMADELASIYRRAQERDLNDSFDSPDIDASDPDQSKPGSQRP